MCENPHREAELKGSTCNTRSTRANDFGTQLSQLVQKLCPDHLGQPLGRRLRRHKAEIFAVPADEIRHAGVVDRIILELPEKLVGVYAFEPISKHPLLRGITEAVHVPHSRLNGLQANDLAECGYELLTHSHEAGVDAFAKKYDSLFVFLQGHPYMRWTAFIANIAAT